MSSKTSRGPRCLFAITLLFILSPWVFHKFNLDIRLQMLFYTSDKGWFLAHVQPWKALNNYGVLPGRLLIIISIFAFIRTLIYPNLRRYRKHFLLIILTSALGAGILVDVFLKPAWGRPRPNQTVMFGGEQAYRPVHLPGGFGRGVSFPSGHSSFCIIFVTLLVFKKRSPWIGYGGVVFGVLNSPPPFDLFARIAT